MTYEQLSYFLTLADSPSIAAAAKKLHISVPGLSKAVSQMEREMGLTLFNRSRMGTSLSYAGRQLLPAARTAYSAMLELDRQTEELVKSNRRRLRLGVANTMTKQLMEQMARLEERYRLTIAIMPTKQIVDDLRAGELDLGLIIIDRAHQDQLSGLNFQSLGTTRSKLIFSPDNQLNTLERPGKEDIARQSFVLFNDSLETDLFRSLEKKTGPLHLMLKTSDPSTIFSLVQNENAVTMALEWHAQNSVFAGLSDLPTLDLAPWVDNCFAIGWLYRQGTDMQATLKSMEQLGDIVG